MFRGLTKLLTKISSRVLNIEDEVKVIGLDNLLEYKKINLSSRDLDDFLQKLRLKHIVNHIIVTDLDGIVIGSTEKDLKEGFKSAAMYNYINSEMKDLSIILIESKGWQIIFKNNNKVYFIKANDNLSKIEVQALVDDLENYIKFIK
ncbi:MAG: hypothetical protein WCY27_03830 [archaeon]|jgi:hypothetical protein|nr:hypothetical protein [archaeon]MDD2477546.1 hypothetical protein [Candidatus ainarchaeum sp.]MDD3084358.1 hypothetical protein [Candidatus ainarchaeum sp.]MDD4221463.1 hypothetical protein [Candidatus ainarchaeum sp.]MDD4662571.1 hypothetical protein [Candidatus ainarchaeum sp.]